MKINEKHALPLRVVHWLNFPLLALMIWSGVLIYWANDVYPGFFPEWFYQFFGVESRLAEGLAIHFLVAWIFVINGAIYFLWFALSGHWREILPTMQTLHQVWPTILHDLGIGEAVPQGKFNAMQRLTYSGVLVLSALAVLSGLAIYKPVQINWLTTCFGGYKAARLIHFAIMISFCLFFVVHIVQVVRAGWNNFRAMVAGFEIEGEEK